MGEARPTLTVDLEGTRMRAAVVTTDGELHGRRSEPTPLEDLGSGTAQERRAEAAGLPADSVTNRAFLFTPTALILGGGLGSNGDLLVDPLREHLQDHGPPGLPVPIEVLVAERGDELLEVCEHDGDVLVFAHGHGLTALTLRWLGLPIAHGRHYRLGTVSLGVLGWKREVRALETWNDRSHLDGTT